MYLQYCWAIHVKESWKTKSCPLFPIEFVNCQTHSWTQTYCHYSFGKSIHFHISQGYRRTEIQASVLIQVWFAMWCNLDQVIKHFGDANSKGGINQWCLISGKKLVTVELKVSTHVSVNWVVAKDEEEAKEPHILLRKWAAEQSMMLLTTNLV